MVTSQDDHDDDRHPSDGDDEARTSGVVCYFCDLDHCPAYDLDWRRDCDLHRHSDYEHGLDDYVRIVAGYRAMLRSDAGYDAVT